jgi:hypothetical protein
MSNEVAELLDLLVARVGDPQRLYTQVYDGDSVLSIEDAEEEEDEPYPRILCPPVTSTTVSEAEQSLGFRCLTYYRRFTLKLATVDFAFA